MQLCWRTHAAVQSLIRRMLRIFKKALLVGRLLATDVTAWVSVFPSDTPLPVRASSFQQHAFAFWAPMLVPWCWSEETARAGLIQLARVGLLVSKLADCLWQPFYKESQTRPQKLCEKYEGQGRLLSRMSAHMRFLVFLGRANGKFVFFIYTTHAFCFFSS